MYQNQCFALDWYLKYLKHNDNDYHPCLSQWFSCTLWVRWCTPRLSPLRCTTLTSIYSLWYDFWFSKLPSATNLILSLSCVNILVSLQGDQRQVEGSSPAERHPCRLLLLQGNFIFFRQRNEKQLGLVLSFQNCPNQSRDVLNFLAFSAIFALITKMS